MVVPLKRSSMANRVRSAKTGEYVKKSKAKTSPSTTVTETVSKKKMCNIAKNKLRK